jgi:hypothetical protein
MSFFPRIEDFKKLSRDGRESVGMNGVALHRIAILEETEEGICDWATRKVYWALELKNTHPDNLSRQANTVYMVLG